MIRGMDVHVLFAEASLPLQPTECHLLQSLLNENFLLLSSHLPTSGSPILSILPALEWGFAMGWQVMLASKPALPDVAAASRAERLPQLESPVQVMGACRVIKFRVQGLPQCRLIGRWIKSGRINGLPREGVRISFRLLGAPMQQLSLMQADLYAGDLPAEVVELVGCLSEVVELQANGHSYPPESAAVADGRRHYHDWERQQRARRRDRGSGPIFSADVSSAASVGRRRTHKEGRGEEGRVGKGGGGGGGGKGGVEEGGVPTKMCRNGNVDQRQGMGAGSCCASSARSSIPAGGGGSAAGAARKLSGGYGCGCESAAAAGARDDCRCTCHSLLLTGDTAAGIQQECADVQIEGRVEADDCPQMAAREEKIDSVQSGLEGVWAEETLAAGFMQKHAQLAARDGERGSDDFRTCREKGAEWDKDAVDIKARLQNMKKLLRAGRA